jgi:hypothetical protein
MKSAFRLPHVSGSVQRLSDDPAEHGQIEGLPQAVIGALLDRLNDRVSLPRFRDKDHRNTHVEGADLLVDIEAGPIRQAHVQKDDIGRRAAELLETDLPRTGEPHTLRGSIL